MAPAESEKLPSLLPYLQGADPAAGRLALTFADPSSPDRQPLFAPFNDAHPLTRMFEGRFATDAGTLLRKVFLVMQRDEHLLGEDEIWPLTNLDIEHSWQQSFARHQADPDDSWIVLGAQLAAHGGLSLLAPLFYCSAGNVFFHPPCPSCGGPLQLCRDDQLLLLAGLKPYSATLCRYLFCPACSRRGQSDFYTYQGSPTDPPTLTDRYGLIGRFALLRERTDIAGALPCASCGEGESCFGGAEPYRQRILPVAFYPFYLLIFEALTLNALDFLPLLGGASFPEAVARVDAGQRGRINCLRGVEATVGAPCFLFPPEEPRCFLEVLYLKLTFLREAVALILSGADRLTVPEQKVATGNLWIKLAAGGGCLPTFWNFSVRMTETVTPGCREWPLNRPSSSLIFQAGLLWFHSLLCNDRQGGDSVLARVTDGVVKGDLRQGEPVPGELAATLAASNVFFHPEGKRIDESLLPLWDEALGLGRNLLETALDDGRSWSAAAFKADVDALRNKVQGTLFGPAPLREGPGEARLLLDALERIAGRWRRGEFAAGHPVGGEERESMETVILSRPQPAMPGKGEGTAPPVHDHAEGGPLPETVMLSPKAGEQEPRARGYGGDDFETVVLTPKSKEDADLPETVIMAPGSKHKDEESRPGPQGEGPPGEESQGEESQGEGAQETPAEPGEDLLAKTMILPPRRAEPGKGTQKR